MSNPTQGTFAPSIFFFKLKPLRTYSRRADSGSTALHHFLSFPASSCFSRGDRNEHRGKNAHKERRARNKQIGKPKTQQGQPTSASKAPLTAQFVVNLYEDGTVDSQMTRLCETNFIDVIRAIARGLFEVFERLPF